jgi:Phage Tail Collar Domain/Collagen triple helix repeat (20 copies)
MFQMMTGVALAQGTELNLSQTVVTPGAPVSATVVGPPGHYFAVVGSNVGAGLTFDGQSLAVGIEFVVTTTGQLDATGRAVISGVPPFLFTTLDRYYLQAVTSPSPTFVPAALSPGRVLRNGDLVVGLSGAAGPTGTTGAQGPTGSAGAAGLPGLTGLAGPTGPMGAVGTSGSVGAPGPVGATGSAGATGAVGLTGPSGPIGPDGVTGPLGPTGPIGLTGLAGLIGATGPSGLTGLIGSIGATGPSGLTGLTGSIGATGPNGLTGLTGSIGATGPSGSAGAGGAAGATGATGASGATGLTGLQGPTGSAGTQGLFGTNTNTAFAANGAECTLGQILLTATNRATGLPASGQLLSIAQNTALFSLIGTTFGGNGTTNFQLPDLRSVAPNGLTYSICTAGIFPSVP